MTDAATPPWVKSAPGLSAAHKFMLGVLWGYGPYNREELWVIIDGDRQPRAPARCWESCEELAELTDQKVPTVRSQLRKLRDDGWFEPGKGSMRTLAWRKPGVFAYGAGVNALPQGVTGYPGDSSTPMGEQFTPRGDSFTPRGVNALPQTLQERSNSTSNKLEDHSGKSAPPVGNARARPLDTRLPAMQPSVHTPKPPAESADHDRNTDTHDHLHPRGRTGPTRREPGGGGEGELAGCRRDELLAGATRASSQGAGPGADHRRGPARDDDGRVRGEHAGLADRGLAPHSDRGVDHRDVKPDNHRSPEPQVQFELEPVAEAEPDDAVTPARIRAWWTSGYLPIRRATYERWRPDARIVKISCNDGRAKEIVRRLTESDYATWAEAEGALDHVVQCAAARVATSKARVVPYGKGTYDTIQNVSPTFWLKQTNFRSLLEDSLPVELPTMRRPDVQHFELPDPCEFFE